MSLNEPLDFKSQPKRKRSETERTAKKHAKNKRQKSKRAASPTSSYLSMRTDCSMDPPTNFKGGETFPLHSRIKRKRETSPVTGYISLKSDNPMNVSKGIASDLKVRAASPTSACLPLKTDWSIDPPTNFKAAETFPLDPRLLTEQDLRCRVCKSMLKDPVSIPCGHNYCNACINAFWDNCAGEYVCPHCGKASETRPVLNINADLAEVVKYKQQTGFSPALPPQPYAGPEDVACDFCSETKLKSVKSCLTCNAFLCETHVRQHYTIPALQKHTLSDVTGDIKTRPSEQCQNSDNSFSSTAGGQQHHADIKEMAVAAKLQTRLKRSAKTFRPKTKEKKDHVRKIALMCSTLQQEVSGLKEKLSKLDKKNTKTEKYEDEEEYDDEEDDFGEEEDDDDDDDDDDNDYEDYGDYGDDGDDNEDYSEKDYDAENDEEEEDDEDGLDSFDDEDGNKDDWEEDDWEDYEDKEDYDDEDSSEKDSDEDYYDTDY
ncbi:uncharacterized protein LOC130081848 isoform X2 [Rhinichthys klamathensis goyatoka]|uniref:uncharacterized protein LOC130081848 isoform X2 n=1 Tax=Rhinichthys klamathensis goyatoka TaxID=3034132 RepID=UPI0024B59A18|nr:uncharacterized protein LOC130081848 isoform X2 [Rhinichthys klamathensis goyatoka]